MLHISKQEAHQGEASDAEEIYCVHAYKRNHAAEYDMYRIRSN